MDKIIDEMNKNIHKLKSDLKEHAVLENKIALSIFGDKVISWSKLRAYNLIPFYSELTGYKTDEMSTKEPKNKNNSYCYFGQSEIDKITSYNSRGVIEAEEYIISSGNHKVGIVKDFRGDFRVLTQLFFDSNGRYLECYSVTDDDEYFGYYYIYNDNNVSEIISVASNGLKPYVKLYLEYMDDGNLSRIYFKNDTKLVDVYCSN